MYMFVVQSWGLFFVFKPGFWVFGGMDRNSSFSRGFGAINKREQDLELICGEINNRYSIRGSELGIGWFFYGLLLLLGFSQDRRGFGFGGGVSLAISHTVFFLISGPARLFFDNFF
jgi:hypothetical protein